MKKLIPIAVLALSLLPVVALAATATDVNLSSGTILMIGSIEVDVSASTATINTIAVSGSSFTVTIAPGSRIQLEAPSKNQMSTSLSSGATYTENNVCNSSTSYLEIKPAGATSTVTVTPSSTICTGSSGSGGGSSGGSSGGGGGGGAPQIQPQTTPAATLPNQASQTAKDQIAALQAQLAALQTQAGASGNVFTKDIALGAKGSVVVSLQTFLEAKGFLKMPKGIAKGTFGGLTKTAVMAYQKSKGIKPINGRLGPLTRAAINADLKMH